VLHSLLLGLREGHYVDRGKGAVLVSRDGLRQKT
jgi:hypothetical protein